MLRVHDDHVGRQTVGKGADFACRTAGGGLAGERERAVARLGDLAHQQVDVVDHVVHPGAAGVLVEAHGPERSDLGLRIGIGLGQRFQLVFGTPEISCALSTVYSETKAANSSKLIGVELFGLPFGLPSSPG